MLIICLCGVCVCVVEIVALFSDIVYIHQTFPSMSFNHPCFTTQVSLFSDLID